MGVETNGTAKSGYSLDLSSGSGRATVINETRLQASNAFTYMFWFKSNGIPSDYSLLLSKRSDTYSSYFVQVDPGGGSLKTILRKYGVYYDTGSIPFNANQWHLLAFTHDGEKMSSYLDGKLISETVQPNPVYLEDGFLGIGGTADGGSLFNGWIDDLRFYGKVLSYKEIDDAFGDGFGDFGAVPDFSAVDRSLFHAHAGYAGFRNHVGTPVGVSGFDASDLSVVGASVDQFTPISASTYSFELNATKKPQRILVSIPAAAGRDDQNITTSAGEMVVVYGDIVTSSEDLVGWWNFDQHQDPSGCEQ